MEEAIKNFHTQFDYDPVIENEDKLKSHNKFIVVGMGGSHLAAGLLKRLDQNLDLLIHRDYGLPRVPDYFLEESLIILSSYSGNTEEVLDVGELALKKGFSLAVIADSGKLLKFGRDNKLPTIDLPNTGTEPRMAVPYTMLALVRLIGQPSVEEKIRATGKHVDFMSLKEEGQNLAEKLYGKTPLVYASTVNMPIAYNWKIKFNETAKIPSFYNIFPEFNHNELSGFDTVPGTKKLTENLSILILEDDDDHERIKKRMNVFEELMRQSKIPFERVRLEGKDSMEKIFRSIVLAEWVTLTLAHKYGVPDAKTPLIAEFKKKMS